MKLYCGDCLDVMKSIEDKSIDMICCDLPYGMIDEKWDSIISFDKLWEQYKRIRNDKCPILLFGQEPFSSYLRISNINEYKYDLIWDKKIPSGMCNAKIQPMKQTENISVFMNGKSFYYPQMLKRVETIKSGGMRDSASGGTKGLKKISKEYNEKYPTTLISFDKVRQGAEHPTQKPIALIEYLIKTYSNEGDLILDNCMGSGTTGVACYNTNRHFIGIEKDETYFKLAKERIDNAMAQLRLF